MPTVLPFHRAVLDDPAFTAADGVFGVHTRWIETEFSRRDRRRTPGRRRPDRSRPRESTVVVEVNGKRLEVVVPAGLGAGNGPRRPRQAGRSPPRRGGGAGRPRARPATP